MMTATKPRLDRLRWHRARLANVITALDSALNAINVEGTAEHALYLLGAQLLWARDDFNRRLAELDAELARGER